MIKTVFSKALLLGAFSVLGLSVRADVQTEFVLSQDSLILGPQASEHVVKVVKAPKYELFSASDWMKCSQNAAGELVIKVASYDSFLPRTATVILTSLKTNYSKVLTVVQGCGRPEWAPTPKGEGVVFLGDLDVSLGSCYWIEHPLKNKSAESHSLQLKGTKYRKGVGTHAPSTFLVMLNGAKRFKADLAIDDEVLMNSDINTYGQVTYQIKLDGKTAAQGRLLLKDTEVKTVDLDVSGAKQMEITFDAGETTGGDHVDLGNAFFETNGSRPVLLKVNAEK